MDQVLLYVYISILLLAALLSTRIMKRFKLPNVTGYILTGIIFGPFVLGLFFNNFDFSTIKEGPINLIIGKINWVSSIALGFIAFSIGTSFHVQTLKTVGKKVFIITIFEALFASVIVLLVLLVAHFISPSVISSGFNHFFKSRNNKLILCIFTVFASVGFCVLSKNQQEYPHPLSLRRWRDELHCFK